MTVLPGDDSCPRGDPHGADDLLLDLAPIAEHLGDIAGLAARRLQASCALMLRSGGRLCTVAASDARAQAMSDWQFGHEAGPSLDAMDTRVAVYFLSGRPTRWPAYARFATEHRVTASMSTPLFDDGATTGSMTAYRDVATPFTPLDQQVAQQVADQAAGAIRYLLHVAGGDVLRAGAAERSVIDTAVGIVMVRDGHDARGALNTLRATAESRSIALVMAARELLAATPLRQPGLVCGPLGPTGAVQ